MAASGAALTVSAHKALAQDAMPKTDGAARVPASDSVKAIMAEVRRSVLNTHTLITHRRLSPQGARDFAKTISARAETLETAGPAEKIQKITNLLKEGARVIGAPPSESDHLAGLEKLEDALSLYPKLFEDEDWKPLR